MRVVLAFSVSLLCVTARAVEWSPVAKVDILGGQFFFQGENTSLSANADWMFSPGIKLSERDALVPLITGQYRHMREVRDLVGGGLLTAESLDTAVSIKWIHLLTPDWNVKSSVSYKNELITESVDEVLGNGLFDYHKVSFGVELERAGGESVKSVRQTLTAYAVRFYHYRALSAQSVDLGIEVNSGDRVLDFNAYDYTLSVAALPWEGSLLSGSALVSVRPYRDQKIVTVSGEYEGVNRFDIYAAAALSARQSLPQLGGLESATGLNFGYTRAFSNQNNYDAQNTRFNPGYYDYGELSMGPFAAARWRKVLSAALSYDYTLRAYDHRPAQDEAGLYGARAIRMDTHTLSLSAGYDLTKNLALKIQSSYRRATSNMLYESTYSYNYWTAHYFAGLGWTL